MDNFDIDESSDEFDDEADGVERDFDDETSDEFSSGNVFEEIFYAEFVRGHFD